MYEPGGIVVIGGCLANDADDGVDVRCGKLPLNSTFVDGLYMAVFQQKVLEFCPVADIQPAIGTDENVHPAIAQQL